MSLWVDKHRPGSLGRLDYHREQAAQLRNLVRARPGPLCSARWPPWRVLPAAATVSWPEASPPPGLVAGILREQGFRKAALWVCRAGTGGCPSVQALALPLGGRSFRGIVPRAGLWP